MKKWFNAGCIVFLLIVSIASILYGSNQIISKNAQISALNAENSKLKASAQVASESIDAKEADATAKLPFSFASAWAKAAFGDNTICAELDKQAFQCVVQTKDKVSSAGALSMMQSAGRSMATLGAIQGSIPYQHVYIKMLDDNGKEAIEVIMKRSGNSYSLENVSGDLSSQSELIQGINQFSNK